MRLSNQLIGFAAMIILLASCGNRHGDGEKLPRVKDEVLTDILDSLSNQEFTSFYSKISTDYQDTSRKVSFKTSFWIVRDSALMVSVKYSVVPVLSAVVTPDSLKMANKRDKCYILQSQLYFKETFGVDFSYRDIENIMMGMPVAFDNSREYHRVKDPYAYWISSHKKRDADRVTDSDDKEVILYYKVADDLRNLDAMRVESPGDSTSVMLNYKTRQLVDGYMVPHVVEVTVNTPKQELKIELEYKKARINKQEELYFVIPESYGACN
ncbi:MAG: DUF4292 domain-containing protein [Crocinitomicaceae bacterium]|nr:DUF4292 domain-containing protein [Crocinitomicaceae bacterium]MDG1657547.1 DUF4292 domain-containing protein [Crocinitomicaceae bacterium]|tara:strand:- start:45 stop:848 length:804 start_codon:yes stop_codon:yes gene_type:complete